MLSINLSSPVEITRAIGQRARKLRLAQNLSQEGLAARSGVRMGTLKLFERTGQASLETVVKLAFALGAERDFEALFPPQEITRIEDVIDAAPRQRGHRK
jgi:transcriptional regulator with XRE-family HTH domain